MDWCRQKTEGDKADDLRHSGTRLRASLSAADQARLTIAEAAETLASMVAALAFGTSSSPTSGRRVNFRNGVRLHRVQPMPIC